MKVTLGNTLRLLRLDQCPADRTGFDWHLTTDAECWITDGRILLSREHCSKPNAAKRQVPAEHATAQNMKYNLAPNERTRLIEGHIAKWTGRLSFKCELNAYCELDQRGTKNSLVQIQSRSETTGRVVLSRWFTSNRLCVFLKHTKISTVRYKLTKHVNPAELNGSVSLAAHIGADNEPSVLIGLLAQFGTDRFSPQLKAVESGATVSNFHLVSETNKRVGHKPIKRKGIC